ncbi:Na+/H+ antiporter subunit E [Haloferula sp.]|uniref:Na+/H+ antiporter subunit E n=1 Tax=Haloferula sp. TaxID=2497595 RepID=UPI003C7260A0
MKALLMFPFFYLWAIVCGAMRIAKDVLASKPDLHPVLLRIPINLTSRQRLLLANLVSMTPGTLSVDEEDDGRVLVVHSLYGGLDPKGEIREIKDRYESVVAKLPI